MTAGAGHAVTRLKLGLAGGDVGRLARIGCRRRVPFAVLDDESHIRLCLSSLSALQAVSTDGGVSMGYAVDSYLSDPVLPSYPETTGYILSTLVCAGRAGIAGAAAHAGEIASYLLGQQLDCGGFRGGYPGTARYHRPSLFNSGQILFGLCAHLGQAERDARVGESVARCVDWFRGCIRDDGSLEPSCTFLGRHRSYYVRAVAGFLEACRLLGDGGGVEAGRRFADLVAGSIRPDGWIPSMGFDREEEPPLHTIAYTLEGLVDLGIFFGEERYIDCARPGLARLTGSGVRWTGGEAPHAAFGPGWVPLCDEVCPTGISQTAVALFKLSGAGGGDPDARGSARRLLDCAKRFQLRGFMNPLLEGAVPGSWPLYGRYESWLLPNWAVKFLLDALLLARGADPATVH